MPQLEKGNLTDESLKATVVALPSPVVDSLRAVEAFKTTQAWNFFRRPGLLMREENLELAGKLQAAADKKSTLRRIYSGERGVGKSMMILHGITTAFVKDWIVINIPDGEFKLNGQELGWYCMS
jgi:small subunit ribosomal protein S29